MANDPHTIPHTSPHTRTPTRFALPQPQKLIIEQIVDGELTCPNPGPNHKFITLLRQWMLAKGLEPNDLAKRLGCSSRSVVRYLLGESCPSDVIVRQIAEVLEGDPRLLTASVVRPRKGRPSKWRCH